MDFFRSADMDLCEISIPKDNAWEIMDTLGSQEILHFIDLNKDQQVFTLVYASRIKRCDEILRKLTTVIEAEANRMKFPMVVPADLNRLKKTMKQQTRFKRRTPQGIFELIEEEVNKHTKLIEEQQLREEHMHHQCLELIEKKAVYTVAAKILGKDDQLQEDEENKFDIQMRDGDQQLGARESLLEKSELRISHLAGTINQSEKERLQKLIFRATRGTALTYFQDIERPFMDYRGVKSYKTVYIVIYQEGEYIKEKLSRLLDSFMGNKFVIEDEHFQTKIND